eukprot:372886-Karenia_brevis.AAC.1
MHSVQQHCVRWLCAVELYCRFIHVIICFTMFRVPYGLCLACSLHILLAGRADELGVGRTGRQVDGRRMAGQTDG